MVNLTRVVLREPGIWLLDEPTASVDRNLERHLIAVLKEAIAKEDILVLVTHKMEMLDLVDRLLVIHKNRVMLDGPKADVIAQLSSKTKAVAQKPV